MPTLTRHWCEMQPIHSTHPLPKPHAPPPWWYVLRLIRTHPMLYTLSSLGIIAMYVWPVLPTLLIARLFNVVEDRTPLFDVRTAVIWVALAYVAQILGRSLLGLAWPAEKNLYVAGKAFMRHNLLRRILQQPGASALPTGSSPGEAVSRLRDDLEHVIDFVGWTADPIGQLIVVAIALVTLLQINVPITLVALLPLLVVLIAINRINRSLQLARKASAESIGAVTGLLGELFGAAQAIKVAGAEAHVVGYLQRVGERRRQASLRDSLLNELVDAIAEGAGHVSTGLMLIAGAQALQSGGLSVGEFTVFTAYVAHLAFVTSMIGGVVKRYRQMGVSLTRAIMLLQGAAPESLVQPVHDLPLWHTPITPSLPPMPRADDALRIFEARDITFRYPNSERGIANLNLSIRRGEFVVITGRIGSGKTTLLRVLLGLLPADAGQLLWNNVPIATPGDFLVPPRVAYTPQTPRLFSETLRDNILMGLPIHGAGAVDLDAALIQAVLERDVPLLEHGLDTRIGPRGIKLSGGQMQRAAAARMFVRNPDLLVFDDLSSALDVETEQLLWARLAARSGITCLVVSNREAALRRADRVLVLNEDGKLQNLAI